MKMAPNPAKSDENNARVSSVNKLLFSFGVLIMYLQNNKTSLMATKHIYGHHLRDECTKDQERSQKERR